MQPAPLGVRLLGLVLLLAALVASSMLALKELGGRLPGCGDESDCDALAATAWARLPGLDWPVAFLGAAFFAALTAAWLARRGVPTPALAWATRFGGAASLLFMGVMLVLGKHCGYCVVTHVANLSFVLLVELASRRGALPSETEAMQPRVASPQAALATGAAVFILASAGLAVAQGARQAERKQAAREESTAFADAAAKKAQAASPKPADPWGPEGFTGWDPLESTCRHASLSIL